MSPRTSGASVAARCVWPRALALAFASALAVWPATYVHHPYLQNMSPTGVTVLWSTIESVPFEFQYSTDPAFATYSALPVISKSFFPRTVTKSSYDFYQYRADLTELKADKDYFYRVMTGTQDLAVPGFAHFHTPGSGSFQFLVYGDSGAATPQQRQILNRMLTEKPDMVVHVGDIAYESGTFDEFHDHHFEYYFTMMAHLPFFPVPGNHEYYSCGQGNCPEASPYMALHAPPPASSISFPGLGSYYSYDWGDAHFVALDANVLNSGGQNAQLAWLRDDLANTNAKWKIVYWHQTPYPLQHHIDDPIDIASAKSFVPILEQYGVQLVLTGHEHNYFRTKPMRGGVPVSSGPSTLYITSGGGGGSLHPVVFQPWVETGCSLAGIPSDVRPSDPAKLCEASWWNYLRVDVSANQIVIRAIDMNGLEFDKATLYGPPSINPGGVVNTATYTAALAPGGLVSIFGDSLAAGTQAAARYPLPTAMLGASVTLNNVPLALFYVSPQQINAQLPISFVGTSTLQVTTLGGSSRVPVTVSDTAPAVFLPSGVLHHSTGAPVTAAGPAIAGEILDVYLTGLGQVNGPLAAGQAAPSSPPLSVLASVAVDIGTGSTVTPLFSGLTPGLAGVYQVSIILPPDLPTNTYPLRVLSQGTASNSENISVRARTP